VVQQAQSEKCRNTCVIPVEKVDVDEDVFAVVEVELMNFDHDIAH